MALISCPDCNRQVSDSAPSCPHCGRPVMSSISSMAVGVERPIELTAKRFKMISVLSVSAIAFGAIIAFGSSTTNGTNTGAAILALGLACYVINRMRIWWHHK